MQQSALRRGPYYTEFNKKMRKAYEKEACTFFFYKVDGPCRLALKFNLFNVISNMIEIIFKLMQLQQNLQFINFYAHPYLGSHLQ